MTGRSRKTGAGPYQEQGKDGRDDRNKIFRRARGKGRNDRRGTYFLREEKSPKEDRSKNLSRAVEKGRNGRSRTLPRAKGKGKE